MSAFGGKADIVVASQKCPLLTQSGHRTEASLLRPALSETRKPMAGGRIKASSPQVLEAAGRQFGVSDRALDRAMAQVRLKRLGVGSLRSPRPWPSIQESVRLCGGVWLPRNERLLLRTHAGSARHPTDAPQAS